MASTANRVAKNTGYLYAKMGITMFISLYTTRLILNSLGASDFGIFNLVGGTISMLMFLNNVMSAVTQRFISYAEGENDHNNKVQIFNTSVFFHLVISVIVFVILEIAAIFLFDGVLKIPAERLYAAKVIYQCAAIATMFSIQTVPYDAVMNAHENMLYYSIIGIVESLFKLLIAIVVVYTAQDKLIIYGLLTAVLSFLLRMVMQLYCHKHYEECRISLRSVRYTTMKSMASFAAWNSANAIVSLVCNYGSGIVLNRFFGTLVNAAQGLTNQVSGQMGVLGNTVTKVVNPVIVKSAGAGNYERLLRSTLIGDKIIFFLTSIVFLPIIANLQPVLKIWLGNTPPYTILFIQLFLTCNIIDTCAICLNTAINGVGDIKGLSTVNAIANAIPLAVCIPCFIYGCGPEYYYWLFMLASLIKLASRAYYSSKVCNFSLRSIVLDDILRTLTACFVTLVLALALSSWCFSSESFAALFASVIIDLIIYVAVYWVLALSKDERLYIADFVRQLSSKMIRKNKSIYNENNTNSRCL